MERVDRELHPIYGAIPGDGDFVRQGEILGLSVDAREVVTAPISGWVRLVPSGDAAPVRLHVHILAARSESAPLAGERVA